MSGVPIDGGLSAPTPHANQRARSAKKARARWSRRLRDLHGWLSALAFVLLMFFAATGLLLNHPDWFADRAQALPEQVFHLPPPVLAQVQADLQAGRSPANRVLDQLPEPVQTYGLFKSSEQLEDELLIRLEGVQGHTDLSVDTRSGQVQVQASRAAVLDTLNDLHRGKNVAPAWRWLIDASAVLVLVLSLAGYVLFFGLKKRLPTTLALTGGSLALIGLLVWSSLG